MTVSLLGRTLFVFLRLFLINRCWFAKLDDFPILWWHPRLQDLRHLHSLLGLVVLQYGTDHPCSGTHGSVQHVHKLSLQGGREGVVSASDLGSRVYMHDL